MGVRALGHRWSTWRAASPYLVDRRGTSDAEQQITTLLLPAVLALSLLLAVFGDVLTISQLEVIGLALLCFSGIGAGFVQFLDLPPLQAILASVLLSGAILALGGFIMARFQIWYPDPAISLFAGLSVGLNGAALRKLKYRRG